MRKYLKYIIFILLLILVSGCLIPQKMINPVSGAQNNSWNHNTFWYHPWGKSGVHKGIDIFAEKGTPVIASQRGIVLFRGEIDQGGNVLVVSGPVFRIHYYAHLDSFYNKAGFFVSKGDTVGFVGNTGNAVNTPAHLHYSIITPLPYL